MKDAVRNTLLVVLVLAVVSLSARNFTGAATTTSTAPARHYYLTKATLNGNQALPRAHQATTLLHSLRSWTLPSDLQQNSRSIKRRRRSWTTYGCIWLGPHGLRL
jgi:hypothetical protein